jgi:hypothetical protein
MQEGGDIYALDTDTGAIVNEDPSRGKSNKDLALANVEINSSWAIDAAKLRILVVGDVGKACLFDCSMGAIPGNGLGKLNRAKHIFEPGQKWIPLNNKKNRGWFQAHHESKASQDYVNTVKFMPIQRIWVTATTSGEVKLWSGNECINIGQLNSENWNMQKIKDYVDDNQHKKE